MNNHIQKIAEQCIVEGTYNDDTGFFSNRVNIERFAELIILQCAKIAREHTLTKSGLSPDYGGTVYVENAINDYFEVKS